MECCRGCHPLDDCPYIWNNETDLCEAVQEEMKPKVVCICGSMRFDKEMKTLRMQETLNGRIVVGPEVNTKEWEPYFGKADEARFKIIKKELDKLHKKKIDLSDEVVVVCPGGYIGESTAEEIDYAQKKGKVVRYWMPELLDSSSRT